MNKNSKKESIDNWEKIMGKVHSSNIDVFMADEQTTDIKLAKSIIIQYQRDIKHLEERISTRLKVEKQYAKRLDDNNICYDCGAVNTPCACLFG